MSLHSGKSVSQPSAATTTNVGLPNTSTLNVQALETRNLPTPKHPLLASRKARGLRQRIIRFTPSWVRNHFLSAHLDPSDRSF